MLRVSSLEIQTIILHSRTLDRRLKPVLGKLEKICEEVDTEFFEALGILGRKHYLNNKTGKTKNYKMGQFFNQVATGVKDEVKPVIPVDLCLFVMTSLEIGDRKYHHLCRLMSFWIKMTTKNNVRKRKHAICPKKYDETFNQGKLVIDLNSFKYLSI